MQTQHQLKNLICIIDWNKGQNDGYSKDFSIMYDNLQERINSFGWDTKVIDGHDSQLIREELQIKTDYFEKPLCLNLIFLKLPLKNGFYDSFFHKA